MSTQEVHTHSMINGIAAKIEKLHLMKPERPDIAQILLVNYRTSVPLIEVIKEKHPRRVANDDNQQTIEGVKVVMKEFLAGKVKH